MKRFQFNLERLLRVRGHETTLAKQNLGMAVQAAEKTRKVLEQATAALLNLENDWAGQSRNRHSVTQWNVYNLLHESLVAGKKTAVITHEEALAFIDVRRGELAEARRRERAIEMLKERQWEAYQLEAAQEEQKETDEIAQNITRVWKEASQL